MFASCDMNLFPTTSIPYEDGDMLILTENDVRDFNNGVLATYRGLHYGSHYQTVDVMTECFNATIDFGNNYGFVHRLGEDFQANNGNVEGIWAAHYSAIKNYNVAIEQVEMLLDDETKQHLVPSANLLMANALFGRASSYLTLARAFSADYEPETAETELSVPLILRYDQYEKPVRATLKEVYDQIFKDLELAEELFQNAIEIAPEIALNSGKLILSGQPKAQAPTLDAVKALMARYFLDVHQWDDAADYAMEVIESAAGYTLAASYDDMYGEFMMDDGRESIMRLYAAKGQEGSVGCTIYTGVSSTAAEGKFFQPLFIPSDVIVRAYSNTDLRKTLWFPLADSEGVALGATGATYPVKIQGTLHEGIRVFTKYIGNPSLQTGSVEDGAHYCKPIMIAEMYLIAAEAYAADGDTGNAAAVLNALKSARKSGSGSGDLWTEIKAEWLKETVGDGQRINCIKRWGDGLPERPAQEGAESIVMNTPVYDYTGRTLDADSYTLVWPIPSYEIKIAPGLQQNPGYTAK